MDDIVEDEMTLDDFSRWKVPQLRNYLQDRGISNSNKRKAELVTLAYNSSVRRDPIVLSELAEKKQRAEEYRQLLKVDGKYLPDPLADLDGKLWQEELTGILNWPPITYVDIADFLSVPAKITEDSNKIEKGKELVKRMLSDYKEGKAYSYFDAEWLKQVKYHPINDKSPYCVLRAECTPSERIRDPSHDVWVIVSKQDGTIKSAHCGCFAGLSSKCNHVAAVLFKVDFAFMRGWTTKSCTSMPCSWNTYKGGAAENIVLQGTQIADMEWRKPHYKKQGEIKSINPKTRKLFQPSRAATRKPSIEGLTNALFDTIKTSSLAPYVRLSNETEINYDPCDDVNVGHELECVTKAMVPPSLPEIAANCDSHEDFISYLAQNRPTLAQIEAIEELTRGQHEVPLWHVQRKGRITGSKIHRVITRMRTVKKEPDTDVSNLLIDIMGYKSLYPNLPALKYGRMQEPHAREAYVKMMCKKCPDFTCNDAGLVVSQNIPILAASPDGFVNCSCHGKGLIEIKCPFSIVGHVPTPENLPYLEYTADEEIQLKRNSNYYSQIQLQLEVTTDRTWSDFYIYTGDPSKAFCERIDADHVFCMDVIHDSAYILLHKFLAKELVNPKLDHNKKRETHTFVKTTTKRETHTLVTTTTVTSLSTATTTTTVTSPSPESSSSAVPKKRVKHKKPKKLKQKPSYICPVCEEECKDTTLLTYQDEYSVGCDKCRKWFHWGCVEYDDAWGLELWLCDDCDS